MHTVSPSQQYVPHVLPSSEAPVPLTILVVDDHRLVREGLRIMLENEPTLEVVGEAVNGLDALDKVAELRPAVVLMDIKMPVLDGVEATRRLSIAYPDTVVLILTSYGEPALLAESAEAGARGYLLKDTSLPLLVHTIHAVYAMPPGDILISSNLVASSPSLRSTPTTSTVQSSTELPTLLEPLTVRELIVLQHVADGQTNKAIGDELGYAEVTVKKHVQSILAKLHAADRTQAAITALRLGFIK